MDEHDEIEGGGNPLRTKPIVRFNLRTIRTKAEDYPDSVPVVTNTPEFMAILTLRCSSCADQQTLGIAGHHVKTVYRALGEIIRRYPLECEEIVPTDQDHRSIDEKKEQVN